MPLTPTGRTVNVTGSAVGVPNSAAAANDFNAMAAAIQNSAAATSAFNAAEAQKNRDFQLYMSNSAHQREMADLEAAGLNPILSARQGASTASGATASGADASGAIAGLLGQMVAAQSAQAVANRNIASAQLIEAMKESHDTYIHEQFPSSIWGTVGSIAAAPNSDKLIPRGVVAARTFLRKLLTGFHSAQSAGAGYHSGRF